MRVCLRLAMRIHNQLLLPQLSPTAVKQREILTHLNIPKVVFCGGAAISELRLVRKQTLFSRLEFRLQHFIS